MTDETDDEFLVKALENIKNQMVEERADITRTDKLNSQIAAEYDDAIKKMTRLIPKIKNVLDIYYLETEEDFEFVIDALENYAENFVVDGRDEEKKKQDETDFQKLQNIIFEFYDDDDDDESEEEEEDDENSGDVSEDSGEIQNDELND